jgi:hypothetical protein
MAPSFARGPPIDWGIDPIEPGWQVKEDEGKVNLPYRGSSPERLSSDWELTLSGELGSDGCRCNRQNGGSQLTDLRARKKERKEQKRQGNEPPSSRRAAPAPATAFLAASMI